MKISINLRKSAPNLLVPRAAVFSLQYFREIFYTLKKHVYLSTQEEQRSLIKERRDLLHDKELDEYLELVQKIKNLIRDSAREHMN